MYVCINTHIQTFRRPRTMRDAFPLRVRQSDDAQIVCAAALKRREYPKFEYRCIRTYACVCVRM